MLKFKKVLNIFLAILAVIIPLTTFSTMVISALEYDENHFKKISDLTYFPYNFTRVGNNIFYLVRTDIGNIELWKTDDTTSGTILLRTFGNEDGSYIFDQLVAMGNNLYFIAFTQENGGELWISDGTVAGTHIFEDINPGAVGGIDDPKFYTLNNKIYFQGITEASGAELWVTDGTSEGTQLVKDTTVGSNGGYINFIKDLDNYLYYTYSDYGESTYQLWKTDGTETGTAMVKDNFEGYTGNAIVYNDELYFSIFSSGYFGEELWKTDGTETGTTMVKNIFEQPGNSLIRDLVILNDKLYFSARIIVSYDEEVEGYVYGNRLLETDGTSLGTKIVAGFDNIGVYGFSEPVVINNIVYFTNSDDEHGGELWRSDGTASGTYMVKDIMPGEHDSLPYDSNPWNKKVINNKVYFTIDGKETAMGDEYFHELWVSDGTSAGTKILKSHLGWPLSRPHEIFKDEDSIYYIQGTDYDDTEGSKYWSLGLELWKYDSSPSYTVTFKDYNGTTLKVETVEEGNNAIAPNNPTRNGYVFKGWSTSYSNVTSDITITALYSVIKISNFVEEIKEPELTIDDITSNLDIANLDTIKGNIKILNDNNELISLYDISLLKDGVKVQPNGYIEIRLPITEEKKAYENLKVIYIDDNNEVTVIPHTIDGDYIVFYTDHLSKYAVIGTKIEEETNPEPTVVDNNNDNNELFSITEHPLIIAGIIITILFIIIIVVKRRKVHS